QQIGDAGRSPPAQDAYLDGASFGPGRGAAGAVMRSGGSIGHPSGAELAVAVGPALGRAHRHLEAFRGTTQGPAVLHDTAGEAKPPALRQQRVTVGHEGPPELGVDIAIHTESAGPSSFQRPERSCRPMYSTSVV